MSCSLAYINQARDGRDRPKLPARISNFEKFLLSGSVEGNFSFKSPYIVIAKRWVGPAGGLEVSCCFPVSVKAHVVPGFSLLIRQTWKKVQISRKSG